MGKAKILRQRLIEDAERMRKIDAAIDADVAALPDAPGGAGEIAEAVDRDDDRLLEGRDVKGRGEMGEVMLDFMKLAAENRPGNAARRRSGIPPRAWRFLRRLMISPGLGRSDKR